MPQRVGSLGPHAGVGMLLGPDLRASVLAVEWLVARVVAVLAAKPVTTRENTKARTRMVFMAKLLDGKPKSKCY